MIKSIWTQEELSTDANICSICESILVSNGNVCICPSCAMLEILALKKEHETIKTRAKLFMFPEEDLSWIWDEFQEVENLYV